MQVHSVCRSAEAVCHPEPVSPFRYIHPCEICGRIFNSIGNLERHKLIHTGSWAWEDTVPGPSACFLPPGGHPRLPTGPSPSIFATPPSSAPPCPVPLWVLGEAKEGGLSGQGSSCKEGVGLGGGMCFFLVLPSCSDLGSGLPVVTACPVFARRCEKPRL